VVQPRIGEIAGLLVLVGADVDLDAAACRRQCETCSTRISNSSVVPAPSAERTEEEDTGHAPLALEVRDALPAHDEVRQQRSGDEAGDRADDAADDGPDDRHAVPSPATAVC
jgi:hypothetical protein